MSSLPEQIIARLKELRDQTRYYGLIMGAALVLVELIQYWQHNSITVISSFILIIVKISLLFTVAFQLTKRIKAEFFRTGMSYGQSFSIIFRLFLYGSLIVGIFSFILNRWLAPDYMSEVLNNTMDTLRSHIDKAQLPTAQVDYFEDFIEDLEDTPTPSPLSTMWSLMSSYLFWGLFTAAIISIFTRDKDINPFAQEEGLEHSNN